MRRCEGSRYLSSSVYGLLSKEIQPSPEIHSQKQRFSTENGQKKKTQLKLLELFEYLKVTEIVANFVKKNTNVDWTKIKDVHNQ